MMLVNLVVVVIYASLHHSWHSVAAQPAQLPFGNCSSPNSIPNSPNQISISQVYAQITTNEPSRQKYLNLTLFGSTPATIIGVSDDAHPLLATMFTSSSLLTFNIFSNATAFCDFLRPPSPLPNSSTFCPVPVGPIAFSTSIPLHHNYEVLSINTRVRIVDTSSPPLELACVDVAALNLQSGVLQSVYGHVSIVLWATIALTIAYWVVIGIARVSAAWRRGSSSNASGIWSTAQRAGFVLASATSGEMLATIPAALRYCTPSMRDVIFLTQWAATLGMISVQWPTFTYPIFAQTAWSTLIYNVTITQGADSVGKHWDPLHVSPLFVPGGFEDQVADPGSPLFINPTIPNTIFSLPPNTHAGIESFAYAVGIRPQDLYGTCMVLFLAITGAVIVLSLTVWLLDFVFSTLSDTTQHRRHIKVNRMPGLTGNNKDPVSHLSETARDSEEERMSDPVIRAQSRTMLNWKSWWRYSLGYSSFHRDALFGNLIRVFLLFHLPITIFSCYQFSRSRSESAITPIVLAIFTFIAFSLALPLLLLWRLSTMRLNKLYDHTSTLLALGPLYNQYSSGSQLFAKFFFAGNLILGIVVGCGQRSGTAQAIIVLICEVVLALFTSIYLPWGRGAAMGVISFFFCVCRIIIGVLLVILSPTVSVGDEAAGWIACAVLLILGLMYSLFLVMLLVKIVEGGLRLGFHLPFDKSRHAVDSGLLGVLSLLGLFGPGRKRKAHAQRYQLARTDAKTESPSEEYSLNRPMPKTAVSYAGSTHGPPSVLKAEQARVPYREEADDEDGHILGVWHSSTDAPAYAFSTVQPDTSQSGFTRIRGGRANFETPYAIMQTIDPRRPFPASSPDRTYSQSVPSPMSSVPSLPSGSHLHDTPSAHVRTRSQTAVLGDVGALRSGPVKQAHAAAIFAEPFRAAFSSDEDDDDEGNEDKELSGRRKKYWFSRRPANVESDLPKTGPWAFMRGRRRSEGEGAPVNEEQAPTSQTTATSNNKSFVVIRGAQPVLASASQSQRLDAS